MKTFDDCRDFRAADAYIGKRAVVERHQFAIGALAPLPRREGIAHRDKEIDQHCSIPDHNNCALQKWVFADAATIRKSAFQPCTRSREPMNFSKTPLLRCNTRCAARRS